MKKGRKCRIAERKSLQRRKTNVLFHRWFVDTEEDNGEEFPYQGASDPRQKTIGVTSL